MTNPYEASTSGHPQSGDKGEANRSFKTRKTVGIILLVIAALSLRGLQRPPGSTGNLADDLPFLGGQLFVTGSLAAVGLFLLLRKPARAVKHDI